MIGNIGVHRTHCCIAHGCKYGDKNCPVVNAEILQDYLCEFCDDNFFDIDEKDPNIDMNTIKKIFIKKSRKLKIKKIEKFF
jgi:hypothetical protein